MSAYITNYDNITPGEITTTNSSTNATQHLLQNFQNELSDHITKQNNLIQSFFASNSKFQSVTNHFMSEMHPCIQRSEAQNRQQIQDIVQQNEELRLQIKQLQSQFIKHQTQKHNDAQQIMRFCETCLDPKDFELFVGALFCVIGYQMEHNGQTHDGGIDLFVRHYDRGFGVIQVKQYGKNSKVTEPQIRDLFGAMNAKQANYAIMVVLSDCTNEALTYSQRENITNLEIWTAKELVAILEEKGTEILMEFIRILKKEKRDKKFSFLQSMSTTIATPKPRAKVTNVYPSTFNVQIAKNGNRKSDKCEKRNEVLMETPRSMNSDDSSLFVDEFQESDNEQTNVSKSMEIKKEKLDKHRMFVWNLQNKPKRNRRKWLDSDDKLLIDSINAFKMNWNESQEQWDVIHSKCKFSDSFTANDIKKHYFRVLKPKMLQNVQL